MNSLHRNPFTSSRRSHKMSIVNIFKRLGVEVGRIQQDKRRGYTIYYFHKEGTIVLPSIPELKSAFSSLSFGDFYKLDMTDNKVLIYVKNKRPKYNIRDF